MKVICKDKTVDTDHIRDKNKSPCQHLFLTKNFSSRRQYIGIARNSEDALFMVKWNREFGSKRNISLGGSM